MQKTRNCCGSNQAHVNPVKYAPYRIVFGGSWGGLYGYTIEDPGPPVAMQLENWVMDDNGYQVVDGTVRYPGSKEGQAIAAFNRTLDGTYRLNQPLDLICYSTGESCLLFAKWHIGDGGDIHKIALLAPTFSGAVRGIKREYPYWRTIMGQLSDGGTQILVVNDRGDASHEARMDLGIPWPDITKGDTLPVFDLTIGPVFSFAMTNQPHGTGMRTSSDLINSVYKWLRE